MGKKITLILAIAMILSSYGAYAFGAASPYWDDNPLILAPGENKDVQLTLQNMVGNGDVKLRAEIINGSDIAKITDQTKDYFVPLGADDVKVNLFVEVPESYELGSQREVTIIFRQVSQSEGGFLEMTGVFTKSFPVKVLVSESESENSRVENFDLLSGNLLWMILAIVIIVVVFLIARKNNKK